MEPGEPPVDLVRMVLRARFSTRIAAPRPICPTAIVRRCCFRGRGSPALHGFAAREAQTSSSSLRAKTWRFA